MDHIDGGETEDAKPTIVTLIKEADDLRRRAEAARRTHVAELVAMCGGSVTEAARLLDTDAHWVYTVLNAAP